MTPHLYVLLANLTLYIAFYVILNIYILYLGWSAILDLGVKKAPY